MTASNPMHEDPPPNEPPATRHTIIPEPDDDARDRPTNPENLDIPEARTMFDSRFMSDRDSEFQEAVRVVAEVGRQLKKDREHRDRVANTSAENQAILIEQQRRVIEVLERTEKSTEANYKLIHSAVVSLQSTTSSHAEQLSILRNELDAIRQDLAEAIHRAIQEAVQPYVTKIETIERRLGEPVQ